MAEQLGITVKKEKAVEVINTIEKKEVILNNKTNEAI